MLTLNDGRSELWQWDTGRTLAVDADCSQVHFSNKVFGRSIDVDVTDGVAIIPDVLLQTDKDLNVWAFVGTAENGYTKISKTFRVNRRNKPADYVFTPVEQTTIAEIAAIAQSVRDDADAGLFDGKPGEDGRDGVDGKDGTSATHSWNGTVLTITSASGTSSSDLKGDKGNTGPAGKDGTPGADGKTPEYGVDYGTPEQIAGIAQQAAEILEPDLSQIKDDLGNTKSQLSESIVGISEDVNDFYNKGIIPYRVITAENGGIDGATGQNANDGNTSYCRTDFIDTDKLESLGAYGNVDGIASWYYYYDENKKFVNRTVAPKEETYKIPLTHKYIRFMIYKSGGLNPNELINLIIAEGKLSLFSRNISEVNSKLTERISKIDEETVDGIYVTSTDSIGADFLQYNINKGDKFKIKVENHKIGTELKIGTHTTLQGSGFTELMIDATDSKSSAFEVSVEANINASFFKIFTVSENTKISIEKQRKKTSADSQYSSPVLVCAPEKNTPNFYNTPLNNGDNVEILLTNTAVASSVIIGVVSSDGQAGFERIIFNAINLPVGDFKINHHAYADYGYVKVFATENVSMKISKKISTDVLSSKIGDVIADMKDISTSNSYFEHQIHAGDWYQIHLYNIPKGCDVKIGTNSIGVSGFSETFVEILNANETEYHLTRKTTIDESAFKCWASLNGVKVTITSFLVNKAVDTTGGDKGYVTCGENVTGGKNDYCVAIGSNTLHSNTGVKNISIGNDNMGDTTGHDNTSTGYHAMFRNTSGNCNSAVGSEAQDDNTTGNYNSALGFCSLQRNNTGSYNVAVGAFALECIYENRYDPDNLKSVSNNTAIGANALANAESGSNNNTAVGHNAMSTRKQYENCIAIGKDADCTKNNQMVLGSSAITEVVLMGNKKLIFNSDGTVTWEEI